jgi:hypothetical protein
MNNNETKEFVTLSHSSTLKKDMQYIALHRHNPLLVNGRVDMDRVLDFLTGYNEFINHTPKPFKPIADSDMKL